MADFEQLIDRIYEAAADSDRWPSVLDGIAQSVEAAGGVLLTRRSDQWLGWRCSSWLGPSTDAYLRSEATVRSQTTARLMELNHAGFVTDQDLFTDEEFLADPMVTEWAGPAGLHHGAATAIRAPSGDLVVVQVQRHKGRPALDDADVACLDMFRPHLARAGLLAVRWRMERLRAAAEALALVGLPAAVLDAGGRVLAANALVEALPSHLKWLANDRLAFTDPAATKLLRQAVFELKSPATISVRSFPVRGTEGPPVVAHLVPTTGQARDLFGGGYGVLVITPISKPEAPNVTLVQGLFDLTPAEARVAGGITEGLSLDQIAVRHTVSVETVRAQAKAVFAKTGTNRQSQVAALLAGILKLESR